MKERPGLVVLRRTKMPALLIETGFINSDKDNQLFEEKFQGKECGCQSCDRRFFKWCEGKLKDCAGLCEKRVKNLAAPVKKHYNRKSDYPCIKIVWIHLGG